MTTTRGNPVLESRLDRMEKSKKQVFFTQPLDHSSDGVYDLVKSAGSAAGVNVVRADSIPYTTSGPLDDIQFAIQASSLVIADISHANPSVMYEIGFAHAEKKPLILIANNGRNVPFDLVALPALIYDSEESNYFVQALTALIAKALENPDAFLPKQLAAEREKRPNVVISYSHLDREYLDRLLVHLKPLERDRLIELWADTRIRPGDRWKKEIEKALDRATVAILIVSADFLASDFITDNELPPLLKNAEGKGTRILPLIVKPCRFTRDKNLRHFQSSNDPKRPLALLPQGEQEVLYDQVAEEVERSLRRN
jgi:hypothetical protein